MKKILLTGKNGQVGWELQRTLKSLGEVVAVGRNEINLADPDSVRKVIRATQPHFIVNAAAYTAVDQAESEPDLALAVNGLAPGIMAEEAKRLKAVLVHFSTDYVFDGAQTSPYREEDAPNPLNVYGRSKLAGEQAIRATGVPHLILRTGWVYGARGRNFLLTILKLAQERSELRVVDDQIGAPTWSRTIAEVTSQMLTKTDSPDYFAWLTEAGGLYHVVAGGRTSWHGFAEHILKRISSRTPHALPKLVAISTREYPLPARRPRYTCLACEKLTQTFHLTIPAWEKSLALCLEELVRAS